MDPTQQPIPVSAEIPVIQQKPNYLKIILLSILGIIVTGGIIYLYLQNQQLKNEVKVTNFKECSEVKGAQIRESYPSVCVLPSGKSFTEELTPEQESRLVPPQETTIKPSISSTPDETKDWRTFTGNSFVYSNSVYSGYSIKYPSTCSLAGNSILICKTIHGNTTLIIDAGGHGGGIMEIKVLRSNETKVISAGEGKINEIKDMTSNKVSGTFWINKTDKLKQEPIFGFEFKDIPSEDVDEFEATFDQILSTFKFL